jgi:hypothetical protein
LFQNDAMMWWWRPSLSSSTTASCGNTTDPCSPKWKDNHNPPSRRTRMYSIWPLFPIISNRSSIILVVTHQLMDFKYSVITVLKFKKWLTWRRRMEIEFLQRRVHFFPANMERQNRL